MFINFHDKKFFSKFIRDVFNHNSSFFFCENIFSNHIKLLFIYYGQWILLGFFDLLGIDLHLIWLKLLRIWITNLKVIWIYLNILLLLLVKLVHTNARLIEWECFWLEIVFFTNSWVFMSFYQTSLLQFSFVIQYWLIIRT